MKYLFNNKKLETVSTTISPILVVSRLAAVCTIVKNTKKNEFAGCFFMVAVQISVTIVSILHLVFIPYAVIYLEMLPKNDTTMGQTFSGETGLKSQGFITKMTNITLISVAAITVRISNLFQMNTILPNLLKAISSVDLVLKRRNNDSIWIMTFAIILILISWPYQLYSILMVTTNNGIAFLMFSYNLYNNFSIICCEFQFVSLCWILKTRFNHLIEELQDLELKIPMDTDESILDKIRKVKGSHRALVECCRQLNSMYGIPLFAILGSLTLNVLFTLYFAIFGGFRRDSTARDLESEFVSGSMDYVIWSFYYFGRFLLVCMAADRLAEKANFTKKIISNLFHISLPDDIKNELWVYWAYVMSNKMHFNASGFFRINISLITSAVSAGATYLVILAQFQSRY